MSTATSTPNTALGVATNSESMETSMEKTAWRPRVGDRVSVNIAYIGYRGEGVIAERSTTYNRGAGTKLYPRFYVQFDDGTGMWASGKSLTRIRG